MARNNLAGTLNVVARGEDNQVWMTTGWINSWSTWSAQGGYTYVSPTVGVNSQTGNMLVSYVDENSYIHNYRAYSSTGL